jgi:hypothetical protein
MLLYSGTDQMVRIKNNVFDDVFTELIPEQLNELVWHSSVHSLSLRDAI